MKLAFLQQLKAPEERADEASAQGFLVPAGAKLVAEVSGEPTLEISPESWFYGNFSPPTSGEEKPIVNLVPGIVVDLQAGHNLIGIVMALLGEEISISLDTRGYPAVGNGTARNKVLGERSSSRGSRRRPPPRSPPCGS